MSYTYSSWVTALANQIVAGPLDPNYTAALPSCIDYAEQRIYSELDLLSTVTRDWGQTVLGNRNFTLPQNNGRFVVTNGVNLITPSSITVPEFGTRNQLTPTTRDYLDSVGGVPMLGMPTNYAMITDQTIIIGPLWPSAGFTLEIIGTVRPVPLSVSNTTTYLTLYLPQLWFAATMVFMTGFQQNWGAQADNPQMAVSWEGQYQSLFKAINIEEQRKRYSSGAWGSLSPTPIATPSR